MIIRESAVSAYSMLYKRCAGAPCGARSAQAPASTLYSCSSLYCTAVGEDCTLVYRDRDTGYGRTLYVCRTYMYV